MFLNKLKIKLYSGKGGNGKISFLKKNGKFIPNGGDGGNGGDIYMEFDSKLDNLNYFYKKKVFISNNGLNGKSNFKKGKKGKDLLMKIPEGTLIKNIKNNKIILNLYNKFKKNIILKGGLGGKGNYTNSKNYYKGFNGNYIELELEHIILSHIIFLGLPNSGKSSLINILTNSNSYINNYIFSTLFPIKSVLKLYSNKKLFILDLPGIIKNSFNGLGLGLIFLKHIKYTKILFHILDLYFYKDNYIKIINDEVYKYNKYYFYKPKIFILNKIDLLIGFFNKFIIKKIFIINNFFYYKIFISSKKKIYYKKIFQILHKSIFL